MIFFVLDYRINVNLEKLFLKIDFSLIWKEIRYKGNREKNTNIAFNRTEVAKKFEITATVFFPPNVTQTTGGEKGIVNSLLTE